MTNEEFRKAIESSTIATITDGDGNVTKLTPSQVIEAGLYDSIPATTSVPVYKTDTGWSTAMKDSPTNAEVSLDETTGKITVKAPALAVQNETFKENLSDTLKTLSANYKLNPDYKYSVLDESGNNVEKSVQDIIADLNKPAKNEDGTYNNSSIEYMAIAAIGIERQKAAHAKNIKLSDKDIIRMNTVAVGLDVKPDTLQLISDLPEAAWLRNIESYDSETGMARYDDIMENAYNKEKVSSEDMIRLWAALESYFEKGNYTDSEEYIKNVATARFLEATQPNMSWIRDVTENVRGFLDGIGGFATDLGTALITGVEQLATGIVGLNEEFYEKNGIKSEPIYIVRGGNQFATDMPMEKVDAKIGRVKFDVDGVPTYEYEDISGSFEAPITGVEKLRAIFKENQAVIRKDMQYLHASQASWDMVGYAVTELAALISAGNMLSDAMISGFSNVAAKVVASNAVTEETVAAAQSLSETATALYASGSALGYGTTAAEAAQIISGMQVIYDIAAAGGKAATLVNFISKAISSAKTTEFIVGIMGESLAEAIVGDPDRFVEVLKNKEIDTDTKNYLVETYIGNALGWGVGLGVGKFLTKAGETTRGRAISANLSRRIFKIQNSVGEAFDQALLAIRRVDGDDLEEKIISLYDKGGKYAKKQANALAASADLRTMRKAIVDSTEAIKISGKSTDEIEEALTKIEKDITELKNAEVALTSMQRQGVDIVQGWLKDNGKGLKEVTENFYAKAGEVADLERKAGDLFKPTRGVVSDMTTGEPLKLFSQTTTNYIKASEKIDFINAYINKYEHSGQKITQDIMAKIRAYKSELPELQGMVRTFVQNAPSDLRLAANNFIDADRKWWSKYETLRASLGLTDADELAWYRGSKLWGTNGELYARTTRKQDLSEYVVKHRDGTSNVKTFDNYEQYMAGATGDFSDPMAEMQIALYDAGNKQAYRSFARSYNKLTGSAMVKVSGEESAFYQKMKKGLQTEYFKNSESLLGALSENVGTNGLVEDIVNMLKTKNTQYGDIKKAKGAMKAAAKNLQKELTEVTSENANRYIVRLGAEDTNALWDDFYDVSVRELIDGAGEPLEVIDDTRKAQKSLQIKSEVVGTKAEPVKKIDEAIFEANEAHAKQLYKSRTSRNFKKYPKTKKGLAKWYAANPLAEEYKNAIGRNKAELYDKFVKKYSQELIPEAEDYIDTNVWDIVDIKSEGAPKAKDVIPMNARRFIYGQARELGLGDLEPEKIKIETKPNTRIATTVVEDDYPGWSIPEHPVWALDESNNNFDGMTRRDYYRKEKGKEFRVIEMPSNEYNQVMMDDDIGRMLSKKEMETANSYVEKFKNGERADIPYIEYDKNGKIIGQEGRHRTIAAYKAGIEKTPVVIEYPVGAELPENLRQYKDVTDSFILREQGYDAAKGGITRTKSRLLSAYDNVNKALAGTADTPDVTFEQQVKRLIMSRNDDIINDTRVQKALTEKEQMSFLTRNEIFYRENEAELKFLEEQYNITKEELSVAGGGMVKDYINDMTASGTTQRKAIDELCKYYGLEGDENAIEYFALSAYMDNRGKYKHDLAEKLVKTIEKDNPDLKFVRTSSDKSLAERVAGIITNGVDATIEEEFHDAYLVVKEISPNAVRNSDEKIMDEVSRIAKEIEGAEANRYAGEKNIIAMRNMQGKVEYYQTDPLLARLVNFQYLPEKMNGFTQAIYNTNYLWAKLFRLGTTAINIKSMVAQSFRDPINMFIGGGAYRTTQQCMDDIIDVAGDDVVAWIKAYEPESFGRLQKEAAETGEDLKKLAVEREFAIGEGLSPTATESYMYRSLNTAKRARLNGVLDVYDDTLGDKTVRAIDRFGETLGKPNEWRETTLRNLAYRNGLSTALKRGYSLDEARTFATFVMNESTTNFTRMTNHLVSLKDTVPYFGSAVNGSKSFFRLLSMDPVGVVGRLTGGLIIPAIALTAHSLLDERNREIYKNIPEYQKEDAIVFVVEGQIISIPVPQELGSFLAPFRQMVEGMYGASTNTFAELAWHDILGFSPVELTGFANLDFAKLESSSPGFMQRIGDGIAKMWAQLAPPVLKSGLEMVTGVDPYTGKAIDKSYVDYDADGNPIVKDYQSGELAKALNNMFRSWGLTSSAPVVQNILSNIFGDGSVDIIDFLVSLATQVPNGGWITSLSATEQQLAMGEGYNPFYVLGTRLTDPITMESYNEAQSAWKTEVTKLYAMKEEILDSDEWEAYVKAKKTTSDPEKLQKINSSGKDIVSKYYETVKNVVINLQKNYGEEFTAAKYATVLSLMTMDEQTLDLGAYGDYLDRESFRSARSQAIQTMMRLGFPSSSATDILGKFSVSSDGDIFVRTFSPLAILQLDDASGASLYSQAGKQHYAVIRNLLSDGNAYDLREDYYKKVDKAYDAKDYNKVEELMNDYNEKIIKLIYPYIKEYSPEAVLKGDVMDYLEDYIMVPSSFMGKGKYYSSKTGLNKQQGYARNYIKAIFNYGENALNGNE